MKKFDREVAEQMFGSWTVREMREEFDLVLTESRALRSRFERRANPTRDDCAEYLVQISAMKEYSSYLAQTIVERESVIACAKSARDIIRGRMGDIAVLSEDGRRRNSRALVAGYNILAAVAAYLDRVIYRS